MGKALRKIVSLPAVTQSEIQRYLDLDQKRKALQGEARDIGKEQDAIESRIMDALHSGKPIEDGPWVPVIEPGRRTVAWKDVVLRRLGQVVVDEEIANAPASETMRIRAREG